MAEGEGQQPDELRRHRIQRGRLARGRPQHREKLRPPQIHQTHTTMSQHESMETLIGNILQWGADKGITGPEGKGTIRGQGKKMLEEAMETYDQTLLDAYATANRDELLDGIGDTCVTLILLAEMAGSSLEECLRLAYDEIKGRTGRMENGVFVRHVPPSDDDFNEPLPEQQPGACSLGEEGCTSCQ